jgi:hypothetical protein
MPLAILVVLGGLLPLACTLLRISGSPGIVAAFINTGARYLTVAWILLAGASILAEKIVGSEHLRSRSLDSQLIRLGMRFIGLLFAIALLIRGADELGFPASFEIGTALSPRLFPLHLCSVNCNRSRIPATSSELQPPERIPRWMPLSVKTFLVPRARRISTSSFASDSLVASNSPYRA